MTSTLARSGVASTSAATQIGRPTPTVDELRAMADRLGQMDLGDPRWSQMAPVLDACLLSAVTSTDGRRVGVWKDIATDVHAPLVVKLRTLAIVMRELNA